MPPTSIFSVFVILIVVVSASTSLSVNCSYDSRSWLCMRPSSCGIVDVAYFRLLKRPTDNGSLPLNFANLSNDANPNKECRIQYLRSYLPEPTKFLGFFENDTRRFCDAVFSNQLQRWIHDGNQYIQSQGYPYEKNCSDPSNCHRPSVGKYLRYISLMEFHRFTGKPNQTFVDTVFPHGWAWASDISACDETGKNNGKNATGSWNCAFQPFSERDQGGTSMNLPHLSHLMKNITLESSISKDAVWRHRSIPAWKNHVVQVMLFGKILNTLSRPSKHVINYISQNMKTIRAENKATATGSTAGNSTSFLAKSSSSPAPRRPTVSMHVRHGDSCNYVLNKAVEKMTTYLENGTTGRRPCFSVDVYMEKLYQLQKLYGVQKVLLATDSEEMIQRALKERSFSWTFLNISRQTFDISRGFIDYRKDSKELLTFSAVADLFILRRGDIFLGGFTSHFSKLVYYSMAGHHMLIPPFISLDYPLSCDTTDKCKYNTQIQRC